MPHDERRGWSRVDPRERECFYLAASIDALPTLFFFSFASPLAFSMFATMSELRRGELSLRGLGQKTECPPRKLVEQAIK